MLARPCPVSNRPLWNRGMNRSRSLALCSELAAAQTPGEDQFHQFRTAPRERLLRRREDPANRPGQRPGVAHPSDGNLDQRPPGPRGCDRAVGVQDAPVLRDLAPFLDLGVPLHGDPFQLVHLTFLLHRRPGRPPPCGGSVIPSPLVRLTSHDSLYGA